MIRVLCFTDEPAAAAGLEILLSGVDEIQLARVCENLDDLRTDLVRVRPHVLLLDATPEVTVRTIKEIREHANGCRLVLWVRSISTEMTFQAIEHGICGILRKNASAAALPNCLRVVAQGGLWFEGGLKTEFDATTTVRLTRREGQLVGMLSSGMKNKEIAAALKLSEGTIKVYLFRLFKKLGVRDRYEVAIHGLRNLAETGPQLQPAPLREEAEEIPCLRSLIVPRASQAWVPEAGRVVAA